MKTCISETFPVCEIIINIKIHIKIYIINSGRPNGQIVWIFGTRPVFNFRDKKKTRKKLTFFFRSPKRMWNEARTSFTQFFFQKADFKCYHFHIKFIKFSLHQKQWNSYEEIQITPNSHCPKELAQKYGEQPNELSDNNQMYDRIPPIFFLSIPCLPMCRFS